MNSKIGSLPKVSVPSGGGAMRAIGESFSQNEFTGTAGLSIPIHATPCRRHQPELALSYSSGAAVACSGWALMFPSQKFHAALKRAFRATMAMIVLHFEGLCCTNSL